MAYYQNVPGNRPPKRHNDGNWEEEGSRYRGKYARKTESAGSGEAKGSKDGRRSSGKSFRPSEKGSYRSRQPKQEYRPAESRRQLPGPEDRSFRTNHEQSYRDFEQVNPAPKHEENLPADNILAGRNPIREALKSGRDLEKILVASGDLTGSAREIIRMAREARVSVQEVDKKRLDEIASHHQGMIAYASAYQYSTVEEMLKLAEERGEDPFLILLDGVTDPHNLGAVIRTAECAGAHGVIVPERRSVGLTPAAVKASAGAVEHMKVARVPNLNRTLEELRGIGIWTYALTMDGKDYQSVNFRGPVALVVGSEGEGISRLVQENCDEKVSLPLMGKIDSLNASVAAGIMMYRVLQARRK